MLYFVNYFTQNLQIELPSSNEVKLNIIIIDYYHKISNMKHGSIITKIIHIKTNLQKITSSIQSTT